jgi:hypothetical protein
MKRFVPVAVGLLALLGCSGNSTAPGPRLTLAFGAQAPAAVVGNDSLVITKAELVIREVELKRVSGEDCAGESPSANESEGDHHSDSSHAEHPEHSEECEEFEAGPVRVNIPLDGALVQVAVSPPAGSYREAEFKIHKVGAGGAADSAFATANPDIAGKSIRVEGTFNGTPFVFESDLSVKQESELDPPLVVTENTATNVTISVKLADWFTTPGGGLIDPNTANAGGANEFMVKLNIKRSFRAFEDRDCDGHDDH